MKKCTICLMDLEENFFSRSSNQCRKCKNAKSKEYRKKWHNENRERVRSVVHEHYLKNKDKVLERTKKWRQENKETFKKSWIKHDTQDPLKRRARKIVWYHLKKGNLMKSLKCDNCAVDKKLQAHHEDYKIPLNVKWLCTTCHGIEHRKRRI